MGLKIRARLSFPKLDVSKYTEALEKMVEVQMRQAARAWLRAVLTRVPVWAGTSQGSLKPLGRALNVAINPTPVPMGKRNMSNIGTAIGESKGTFQFVKRSRRFIFIAKTNVPHFEYNNDNDPRPEIHLTHNPVPWKAFQAGDAAWKAYMDENLKTKIPKIKDFIRYKTIIVNG